MLRLGTESIFRSLKGPQQHIGIGMTTVDFQSSETVDLAAVKWDSPTHQLTYSYPRMNRYNLELAMSCQVRFPIMEKS